MGTMSESFTGNEEKKDAEVLPGLVIRADGTVLRNTDRTRPTTMVAASPVFVNGVASKDLVFDSESGIWGRVFIPESVTGGLIEKLPIVVYFHGGGFCMGDAGGESPTYQATRLCKTANVVVISASYRLAPESRLPIAFNDAYTTMFWLQRQCKYQASGDEAGDPWLMSNVDFSRVFVMGQSAGGNIAHHVIVSKPIAELHPLTIEGVVPVVPFFSAEVLSESEKKFPDDDILPLGKHHTFWRLALPSGANRDHPFCNPLSADAPKLAEVKFPKMLLIVAGKDPLYTRQIEYFNAMKQAGKEVELVEVPEGTHVFRKIAALEAENVRVDKAISDFIHKSHLS
ncbi:hypothetical protein KC19_6G017600 [Ceratodon purpureus]|uniref:Alpha/beta hydrolase fold-3 domain-containing protein n=1 Tax=Ceratodon purpureus TaxID=3225 RepID=A0A8T0H939_CERPU|nr:hypothetical protein KC19_6G017600 [Ceratodon purpureus]KAG0568411.1 hypothetical protein KC19_6G017600 [Ceratodon purpureus]